jgi:uncharacterized protein YfcZ (UPF0381/DUF406 family)
MNQSIQLMNQQVEQIKELTQKNQLLETMVANLQKKIAQNVKNEPVEIKSDVSEIEKHSSQSKTAFTDILLTRINELEKLVNSLKKNRLDDNNSNIPTVFDVDPEKNIKPLVKSKTIPEVKVNIR